MTKWEYAVFTGFYAMSIDALNAYGISGYELISLIKDNDSSYYYIFKRQIVETV